MPIIIIMIWISGFILNMPDQFFYTVQMNHCTYLIGMIPKVHAILLYVYYAVFHFVLPAFIMLTMYIHMGITMYRAHQEQKTIIHNPMTKENLLLTAQNNIIFICMTLLFLYCICWTWNQINLLLFITQTVNLSEMNHHISSMIVIFNSCVNPLVYTFRYREFQHHLKLLVFCRMDSRVTGTIKTTSFSAKKTCTSIQSVTGSSSIPSVTETLHSENVPSKVVVVMHAD